ncbi:DUF6461 domain-containing protein [Lentzea flava]|uniref:Uncharacterized protein n=1 Tax=Lentzea flava TaxID=103732 RepID=A0ABQ2UGR1_9PSEU|nr:DUF6461 domain-containing protein [Lentzea flava]MCP2199017.1 hypothetical protein [Lentzea flava]GGU32254.1 hypothetical protein GCM10010178_25520 [Lentzea flava]
MQHDLSWADSYHEEPFLGEIFAIAFVRGIEPLDALRLVGGHPDTLAERTPDEIHGLHEYEHGYPEVVSALSLGEWTVLLQPTSFWLVHLVDALSRGTEAVAVLRHDYASPSFAHAVDGEVATEFNLNYPDMRHGTNPDGLLPQLREAGFDPDDDEGQYEEAVSRALRLAGLVTGVLPTFEQLTAPLPSMHFDHWFSRTRPSGTDAGQLARAEAIVAELGLGDTPGLAAALDAARRGERVVVTPDSELGRHVREWLALHRRASWSLNDHNGRYRLSEVERQRAYRFGYLTEALRGAFRPDLA